MTRSVWALVTVACASLAVLGCGRGGLIFADGTSGASSTSSGASDSSDTGIDCPAGRDGCPCEPNGFCDADLICIDDVCQCPPGTQGCDCGPGDTCDEGLRCNGDVCELSQPECGNGIIEAGEECDQGPSNGNENLCKSDCTNQFCGDGFTGPGEGCDDANDNNDDLCTNECALSTCGDGILHDGEDCDDGNRVDGDACLNTCVDARCGDTVTWQGVEECDDGENGINTDACLGGCIAASCGDTLIWEGVEGCDDGNLVDFDGCNSDCAITASIAWEDQFSGPIVGGCDNAFGIHVDADDNVIAVGAVNSSTDPTQDCDILIRKYENDGALLWSQTFASPSGACDEAWGVETDPAGNIFVSGTIFDPNPAVLRNQWMRKHGPNGNELWTITFNGGDQDFCYGAAVDSDGNVIHVGATQTGINGYDITVRKLNGANASVMWERFHDGSGFNDFAIDVETRGRDIYVGGFETMPGQNENGWIRRYNTNGGTVWTVTHNGAQNGPDRAGGLAIDNDGNVFAVGFETGATNHDMWVAKYNNAGIPLWSAIYDNPDLLWADRLQDVAVDNTGAIVVVGHEWAVGNGQNGFDLWMRKYTSDGEEVWTLAENGPGDGDDFWYAVEMDSGNHPIVGGAISVDGQCTNMLVRKYNR